jgi:hypothetical protein
VDAQIDIHEPADGDGRTQHGPIVGPAVARTARVKTEWGQGRAIC